MGILGDIATTVKETGKKISEKGQEIKKNHDVAVKKKTRQVEKETKQLVIIRKKSIPLIKRMAQEVRGKIEYRDKGAYVSKEVNGHERGVEIPYGMREDAMRVRLEVLMRPSTTERFAKGADKAAKTLKTVKKGLGDVADELKSKNGGMYSDPNFGGQFRGGGEGERVGATTGLPPGMSWTGSGGNGTGIKLPPGYGGGGGGGGESADARKVRKMFGM